MILYIIRHAEAVDSGSDDIPDDYRVLSPKGREVVREVGRWCVDQKIQVDQIVSSPLLRAVQTAEILSAVLHISKGVEISLALAAGGAVGGIMRILPLYEHLKSLALVGHEPNIGITTSTLLDIEKKISFSPGSICSLIFHGIDRKPQATLQWIIHPVYDAKTHVISLKTFSSVES
jgi:phosphohistidine phosphatase